MKIILNAIPILSEKNRELSADFIKKIETKWFGKNARIGRGSKTLTYRNINELKKLSQEGFKDADYLMKKIAMYGNVYLYFTVS